MKNFYCRSYYEKTKSHYTDQRDSFLISVNIKLHLISWIGDNLSDNVNLCIEATQSTLFYLYYHHEYSIR